MTDMSVRFRNRVQDSMMDWQDTRYRKAGERQQHMDIRRSRMTCSADFPGVRHAQDWTGGIPVSSSGKNPVVGETRQKAQLVSGEGIRRNVAVAALVIAGVILCALLLGDLAGIGTRSRTIGKLNSKITAIESKNENLRLELQLSTGSATVCTEAVKMDLISSNGARTIRLTAPQEAQFTLSTASAAAENADMESRMMSYAGD